MKTESRLNNHTIILDSFSDTSPSAPSIHTNTESQTPTTTLTRNVTPVTPSKRPRSYITDTSSSTSTFRPLITEIPLTPRTQPSLIITPIVNIPNPESVERYVNYKQPTAVKTVGLQPQLNLVHVPDTECTELPPLQLPSEKILLLLKYILH